MVTVATGAYKTNGGAGRKLIKLGNGWEIAVFNSVDMYNSHLWFRKREAKSKPWDYLKAGEISNLISYSNHGELSWAVTPLPDNKIGVLVGARTLNVIEFFIINSKGEKLSTKTILGVNEIGEVDIITDPSNGHLYAVWSSRSQPYLNSLNIRYAKSTDGGVTWSAIEQLTTLNVTGLFATNPTITIVNGKPAVFFEYYNGTAYYIKCYRYDGNVWLDTNNNGTSVYSVASQHQASPQPVVDKDGTIALIWASYNGKNYNLAFAKSIDGGATWPAPLKFSELTSGGSITTDKNGKYTIVHDGNAKLVILNSTNKGETWDKQEQIGSSYNPSTLFDPMFSVEFEEIPPTVFWGRNPDGVFYTGEIKTNQVPMLTVNTTNDRTLYENDSILIDGQATDADEGQIVNVRYRIDSGTARALQTGISDGSTPITFSKRLTFKLGKLYDGETELTGALSEGQPYILRVWAEDDQGGKSADIMRTFFVVPNRAPILTIDDFSTQSNLINNDSITVSGSVDDPEKDNVIVSYSLNASTPVEVYNGPPGTWSFDINVRDLKTGQNSLIVETSDIYGLSVSEEKTINKTRDAVPLLNASAIYKITPPVGSAKEILAWIQREVGDLVIDAEISMTNAGEAENFVPMTVTNTAPVNIEIMEDEFHFLDIEPKENIMLKLNLTRTNPNAKESIKLVSGVLE